MMGKSQEKEEEEKEEKEEGFMEVCRWRRYMKAVEFFTEGAGKVAWLRLRVALH
jgi:hypothetical protein